MNTPSPAVDVSTLPPQLRRLVRALGVADTLRLLKHRGGTRLEFPDKGTRGFLVELLGLEQTRALLNAFEGQPRIDLPKLDKITTQIRDREIRADHAAGISVTTLAVRHDLTMRQIWNICQESAPRTAPEQQLDLLSPL